VSGDEKKKKKEEGNLLSHMTIGEGKKKEYRLTQGPFRLEGEAEVRMFRG